MHAHKQLVNKVFSVLVVISTMVSSMGVVAVQPVRAQGGDDPSFVVYLPVVMRSYVYVPPAVIKATIEPGVGGEIGSPDGQVRVTFTLVAVTQTTHVRYQESTVAQSPADLAVAEALLGLPPTSGP